MEGLYLLGFGPRTAAAARDLSIKLYPALAPQAEKFAPAAAPQTAGCDRRLRQHGACEAAQRVRVPSARSLTLFACDRTRRRRLIALTMGAAGIPLARLPAALGLWGDAGPTLARDHSCCGRSGFRASPRPRWSAPCSPHRARSCRAVSQPAGGSRAGRRLLRRCAGGGGRDRVHRQPDRAKLSLHAASIAAARRGHQFIPVLAMVMKNIRITNPPSSSAMIRARSRWRLRITSSSTLTRQEPVGDEHREQCEQIEDRISEQVLFGLHLRRARWRDWRAPARQAPGTPSSGSRR